jgi:predicted flap endonuclease-1-like 5' DNA nuclease/type II secretory pathway pseudopilin PulG
MPEMTLTHLAIVVGTLIAGVVVGWAARSNRAGSEKSAINATWREQLDAQRNEHERLIEQNKSLMEQNSQYQASNKDAKMRASELSSALKEAFERRDDLQRQLKDIRANLERVVAERDQLRDTAAQENLEQQVEERDASIEKLSTELKNWQDRLPPLIQRYQQRNAEAEELEEELAAAHERIESLEQMIGSEQTRVDPVDADALGDSMDASNEPIGEDQEEEVQDEESQEEGHEEMVIAINDPDDVDVAESQPGGDDLQMIKGVGPAIEKTLNEMGISRFDQIAQMSEYDIDRVAHRLKGFRSRIYREDWIGQARDLYDRKVDSR